jgi:transcription termination factor Rho
MYDIIDLNSKLVGELREIAKQLNIPKFDTLKKQELVYKILDQQAVTMAKDSNESTDANKPKRGRKPKSETTETPQLFNETKSDPRFVSVDGSEQAPVTPPAGRLRSLSIRLRARTTARNSVQTTSATSSSENLLTRTGRNNLLIRTLLLHRHHRHTSNLQHLYRLKWAKTTKPPIRTATKTAILRIRLNR